MISEKRLNTLEPGNVFRDWLIETLGDRIKNKKCDVIVYEIVPASHTVCRYEFVGENYNVIAKFYAEQKGAMKGYDPILSMNKEFQMLITEHVNGKPFYMYLKNENGLYDKLTILAITLRKLHDNTKSDYFKEYEFAHFHNPLDQLHLNGHNREIYNQLLGEWWYNNLIDQDYGCLIHNDANPMNYVFHQGKVFVLDFESSWDHANFVHDLGIVAAELKYYFAMHKGDGMKAEPYIGHFLWHYGHGEIEFQKITSALPFFMAMGLLRRAKLKTESMRLNSFFMNQLPVWRQSIDIFDII